MYQQATAAIIVLFCFFFLTISCFVPAQNPRGGQDTQAGGAGVGSRSQRHCPGAHRGQTVQPRGKTPRRRADGSLLMAQNDQIFRKMLRFHVNLKAVKFAAC